MRIVVTVVGIRCATPDWAGPVLVTCVDADDHHKLTLWMPQEAVSMGDRFYVTVTAQ